MYRETDEEETGETPIKKGTARPASKMIGHRILIDHRSPAPDASMLPRTTGRSVRNNMAPIRRREKMTYRIIATKLKGTFDCHNGKLLCNLNSRAPPSHSFRIL